MGEEKRLRLMKIKLYDVREELEKELKLAKHNNTGVGAIQLRLDDVNNQLKTIEKKLNELTKMSSCFNY